MIIVYKKEKMYQYYKPTVVSRNPSLISADAQASAAETRKKSLREIQTCILEMNVSASIMEKEANAAKRKMQFVISQAEKALEDEDDERAEVLIGEADTYKSIIDRYLRTSSNLRRLAIETKADMDIGAVSDTMSKLSTNLLATLRTRDPLRTETMIAQFDRAAEGNRQHATTMSGAVGKHVDAHSNSKNIQDLRARLRDSTDVRKAQAIAQMPKAESSSAGNVHAVEVNLDEDDLQRRFEALKN